MRKLIELECNITNHDKTKLMDCEYYPYLYKFYPFNSEVDHDLLVKQFDLALNHHQKHNAHHWQYWILIDENGQTKILDMDKIYIIEMICDWHSFTLTNPELTAYKWWNENKGNINVSLNTRIFIDKYIELFKEPLKVS